MNRDDLYPIIREGFEIDEIAIPESAASHYADGDGRLYRRETLAMENTKIRKVAFVEIFVWEDYTNEQLKNINQAWLFSYGQHRKVPS